MALWTKAQQLQGDTLRQVQTLYGGHFPIEVRHFLAEWIEDKPWNDLDPDNLSHESFASSLVMSLVQELDSKAQQLNSPELFPMRLKLTDAAAHFRNEYSHNPLELVRIIRHCLNTELKLVQVVDGSSPIAGGAAGSAFPAVDPNQEIVQQIEFIKRKTQESEDDLRGMQQEQESFVIQYQERAKLQAHLTQLGNQTAADPAQGEAERKLRRQKEMVEQMLSQKAQGLLAMRMALADKHHETFNLLNGLQSRVLDEELIRWKRDQQLAGNGAPFNNNLDIIQEWCESLAEIIWQNRQQIKRVEFLRTQLPIDNPGPDKLPQLNTHITSLLSSLVTSTFIIEKQPPQVMKTNTRFTSTVRLLVGGKLNVHMTPPQVKVTIISESQANALLRNDKMSKGECSGEILNNTGTMEYHQATRQLSVSFRNMQLRKIKRAERKGTEVQHSVMDEKFSLLFQSQFKVGGGELVFQVWTLSLPVVVIVHGNQEPHAWATVSWDNAFAEAGRVPFAVPDKVPWHQVADMLNCKFKAATGRGLSDDNFKFLAGKAFRNMALQDYTNMLLTWAQFCREPLPDRNFTFWEWFYAIMKLTKEHLRNLWNDGLMIGFVSRKVADEMLRSHCKGTFLLRFSDSELGGVTIAWLQEDPQSEQQVYMLQPFTSRDFAIRSLADRINDLKPLVFLFPDINKDQAFSKYYTPVTDTVPPGSNGYVKPMLVTHVPGWTEVSGLDSYPATPQAFQPQSPESSYIMPDPPSVNSNPGDPMHNTSMSSGDVDYAEFIGMDLSSADIDMPGDFSNINVNDLLYSKNQ